MINIEKLLIFHCYRYDIIIFKNRHVKCRYDTIATDNIDIGDISRYFRLTCGDISVSDELCSMLSGA